MNRPPKKHCTNLKFPGKRIAAILGIFMFSLITANWIYAQDAIEEKPLRATSSDMIFAANSALRGVEGELLIWVNEPPLALTPSAWRSSAAGTIVCGTESKTIRFDFQFQQTTVNDATAPCKVGIVSATATNLGASTMQASLWFVWRYAYSSNGFPLGFSLGDDNSSNASTSAASAWKPDSAWYFLENGFIRNGRILYAVSGVDGWERRTWVRRPTTPYRDLTEQSFVGYTLFRRELEPNQQASVRALVPHQSIEISKREILSQIIPRAE